MKRICRKAYCNYIENYSLDVNEELLNDINEYLNKRCSENVSITLDDIIAIANRDYDVPNKKKLFGTPYHFEGEEHSLFEEVDYYIDLAIWDSKCKLEHIYTQYWEDTIEDIEKVEEEEKMKMNFEICPSNKKFLDNIVPREGEPVHSDVWSQVYDYILENYGMLDYTERSEMLSIFMNYLNETKGY